MGLTTLQSARRWLSSVSKIVAASAVAVFVSLASAPVFAAGQNVDSKFKLQVDPVDCTVDIVQNGSGQSLQIPAHSCLPIVPSILTPVLDGQPNQFIFNDDEAAGPLPIIVLEADPRVAPLTPIASSQIASQTSYVQSLSTVTTVLAGVGAVAAATLVGVDMALFEMSYSKSAVKWAKGRFSMRFGKKFIG